MFAFLVAFLLFFLAGVFSFLDASVTVVIIGIVLHILHRVIDGLINCCFNMVSLIAECRIRFLSILRSEEHTSELQSRFDLVCRLLLEKIKLMKKIFLI